MTARRILIDTAFLCGLPVLLAMVFYSDRLLSNIDPPRGSTMLDSVSSPAPAAGDETPASADESPSAVKDEPVLSNVDRESAAPQQPISAASESAFDPPTAAAKQPAFEVVAARKTPAPEQVVQFFSIKDRAESVVFVVDCSSSMAGPRFAHARLELAQAVVRLRTDQQVFVVFFNQGEVPLFSDRRGARMESASLGYKCDVVEEMRNIRAFGGTNPEPSMRTAIGLNPDVIYLLSDGEFNELSPDTMARLANQKIKVHAILFENLNGGNTLKRIADRTGGTFTRATMEKGRDLSDANWINSLKKKAGSVVTAMLEIRGESRAHAARLARASADDVALALDSSDLALRLGALNAVFLRRLPLFDPLLAALADPHELIRSEAHAALMALADNRDYGSVTGVSPGQQAAAILAWRNWVEQAKLRNASALQADRLASASEDELIQAWESTELPVRWGALMAIRSRKLRMYETLLAALSAAEDSLAAEAHAALVALGDGHDQGPVVGITVDQRATAIAAWRNWSVLAILRRDFSELPGSELVLLMADPDPARRTVAVAEFLSRKSKDHVPLIPLLADEVPEIRRLAGEALFEFTTGKGLGPSLPSSRLLFIPDLWIQNLDHADPLIVEESRQALLAFAVKSRRSNDKKRDEPQPSFRRKEWEEWWTAEKERRADRVFRLGEAHLKNKTYDAADEKFREVIEKYPGTKKAAAAQRLLTNP